MLADIAIQTSNKEFEFRIRKLQLNRFEIQSPQITFQIQIPRQCVCPNLIICPTSVVIARGQDCDVRP